MRAVAESNLKKLIYVVLFAALVVVAATFLDPFTQGYEVKTACRLSCNEYIKNKRFGQGEPFSYDEFVGAARRAGVKLKPEQYSFDAKEDRQAGNWTCTCSAKYPATVEWAFIGDIFAMEKFVWNRHIRVEHTVANSY